MRGILGVYDLSSGSNYSLLQRHHLENTVMRQFIEKDGNLLRFNINVPIVVTDSKPLQPYGDPNATKEITIPNLYPMNPLVGLWPKNVYNPESAFPVKVCGNNFISLSNFTRCFLFKSKSFTPKISAGQLSCGCFKPCSYLH